MNRGPVKKTPIAASFTWTRDRGLPGL